MVSSRLNIILENVTTKKIADIGTDHAYIPIALTEKGIKVIATDINPGPLENARKNIERKGLAIELRLGAGLSAINLGECEEIIIAGMGGELIQKILSDDLEKAYAARLLLQPMKQQAELRRFLLENGFEIVKEDLAKEGQKIYNLIIARQGNAKKPKREIDLHLPPALYKNPLFPELVQKKKREFSKQYNGLIKGRSANYAEKEHIKKLLSDTEFIESEIE